MPEPSLTHRVSVNYLDYALPDDARITVRWDYTIIRVFEAEFTVAQLRELAGGALVQQLPSQSAPVVNLDELGELAISCPDVSACLAQHEPTARTVKTIGERGIDSVRVAPGTRPHLA